MSDTGTAHKIVSVILRFLEFCCAVIVLGILSRFCYVLSIQQVDADGRIIYAMVVAGIGIIYSFFFCPPFKTLFLGFPFDFVMFVMWLIAYCLLQTVGLSLPVWSSSLAKAINEWTAILTLHRKQVATLALHVGTTITGATIGVVSGESALLGQSTSTEPDVRSGERSWPSHSSRGSSTF